MTVRFFSRMQSEQLSFTFFLFCAILSAWSSGCPFAALSPVFRYFRCHYAGTITSFFKEAIIHDSKVI